VEKDDEKILQKIDDVWRPGHDWIQDYEATGNFGEEMNELDDDAHHLEEEVYDDLEDNVDVVK